MKRITTIVMLSSLVGFSAPAHQGGGTTKSPPPVIDQTQQQMEQRISAAKKRTGKTLDLKKMGKPVSDPRDPKRRRCIQLSPFEWNLAFPERMGIDKYGGTVCGKF